MKAFGWDICKYLDQNSHLFSFGSGINNLKFGELIRGERGVFVKQGGNPSDNYLPFQDYVLDFWAVSESSEECYEWLLSIYNIFHQGHHYDTDSYTVFFSHALSNIQDMDRDAEGRKLLKISIRFICTTIIS